VDAHANALSLPGLIGFFAQRGLQVVSQVAL
jgi:hypothetical protein